MRTFLIRRVLLIVPTVIGVTIAVFVISRVMPGDPAALMGGDFATPQEIESIREEFGLNKPIVLQYVDFLAGLSRGDLGMSMLSRRSVAEDLIRVLPATLELTLLSLTLAVVVGMPLGVLAAVKRDRATDHLTRIGAISAVSLPRFWLALMLQLIFALGLSLLPVSGRLPTELSPPPEITGMYTVDSLLAGDLPLFVESVKHLILPVLALSLGGMASIMRMMRASMVEVLQKEYILMARAAGLPEGLITRKYALKNAATASVTVIGASLTFMLAGAVLVETVFAWPGLGSYIYRAVTHLDYQPIVGATLVIGALVAVINLGTDLAYAWLDPRVRLD